MRLVGDGRLGHAADGPFNAIHVGAAAKTLPQQVRKIGKLAVLEFRREKLF